MATLELTTTPQELVGSYAGCFVQGDAPFMFGYGSTQPTQNDGASCKLYKEGLNYSGGFGSVWVWQLGENSQSLYYAVAV